MRHASSTPAATMLCLGAADLRSLIVFLLGMQLRVLWACMCGAGCDAVMLPS